MRKLLFYILPVLLFSISSCVVAQDTPELNKKIIAYVDANIDKKISRGECWDLVAGALNNVEAEWESPTGFGQKVKLAEIKPGDVIIFDKVTLKGDDYMQSFWQHYALVYKLNDDGSYQVAHQNYNNVKTVSIATINPKHLTKGSLTYFRPQSK